MLQFVNVRAGEYLIVERVDKIIIAEVHRKYKFVKTSQYLQPYYEIDWYDDKTEEFRTLADITNKYDFDNHPGYGKILNEQPSRRKPYYR